MSDAEISLLEKGLSFIPTPKLLPVSNILENRNKLIRNIKIKCAFKNKPNAYDPKSKTFVAKSTWIPDNAMLFRNGTLQPALDAINKIESATREIIEKNRIFEKNGSNFIVNNKNVNYNLNQQEFSALNRLKNNTDIVIKPADKGGSLVIMDLGAYLLEANKQLNDQNYYKKLNMPLYFDNKTKIIRLLTEMHNDGWITQKQLQYLSGPDDPRPRRFYILPKIHKNPNSWTIPNKMPPGRPVVSDIDSESYRVSDYVDSFLKPLACRHASYIKNSYDFISKIKNSKISKNTFLVTGDVTSLYTNMKHDIILSSISKIFKVYPDANRPEKYLLKLIEIMMKYNDFEFNSETFQQVCGCPQGKIIGPSAANIYLLDFDHAAMTSFRIRPSDFFRFLDDVFFLWEGSLDELHEFETFLNNLIPGIEIKLEPSLSSVNFLDVTIYKKQTSHDEYSLATKVYVKPTDTQNLLHTQSFHPPHTTRGILKSQLIRYKRLSSTWDDFVGAAKTLFQNLYSRGYKWSKMWEDLKYVWYYYEDRELDKRNDKINQNLFPIVVTYDNVGRQLGYMYKNILQKSNLFDNSKLILAYKNHQNIGKSLISSKLKTADKIANKKFLSKKCSNTGCKACNYVVECRTFSSHNTNKTFNLKHNITCKSKNLIYLITCTKCHMQYVGQTSRTLADRINNHLSCIRTHKDTPISIHFNSSNHSINNFSIQGIESLQSTHNIHDTLDTKEHYWQHKLNTIHPLGINLLNKKYT